MSAVVFDLSGFRNRYPEFASLEPTLLAAYFSEAALYCNNTDASPISDASVRSMILNMIVAHISELQSMQMVGRIANVRVGGLPVHAAYAAPTGSRAWFDQTRYGAAAWQAMGPYRRAFYVTADNVAPWEQ